MLDFCLIRLWNNRNVCVWQSKFSKGKFFSYNFYFRFLDNRYWTSLFLYFAFCFVPFYFLSTKYQTVLSALTQRQLNGSVKVWYVWKHSSRVTPRWKPWLREDWDSEQCYQCKRRLSEGSCHFSVALIKCTDSSSSAEKTFAPGHSWWSHSSWSSVSCIPVTKQSDRCWGAADPRFIRYLSSGNDSTHSGHLTLT